MVTGPDSAANDPPPLRPPPELGVLRELGLPGAQARAYLSLLRAPRTVTALANELGVDDQDAATSVDHLLESGMVVRLPGRELRYRAVPPEDALRPLLARHEELLHEGRRVVSDLSRASRLTSSDLPSEDYVEVVVGKERVVAQADRYWADATEEVLAFVKGPVLDATNAPARDGIRSGVQHRSIWDRSWIEQPGMVDVAREWVRLGESIRVTPVVPAKLVLFDRTIAVFNVTETLLGERVIAGFATRHPEVVQTLVLHFELMWSQAVPAFDLSGGDAEDVETRSRGRLIECLAAGMTDAAIARELGLSKRTLSRRVNALLYDLRVSTRFQAGLRLAVEANKGQSS